VNLKGAQALRIGMFGGAFDPPHVAHVALALAAVEQLDLDRLHVIPTGFAWHKPRALTDSVHRLAMCELAFSQVKGAVIDPRETLRIGPTFTADTLAELKTQYPGAEIFLVLGEDQAKSLSNWQRVGEVLNNAIICVAARPDSASPTGDKESESLEIPGIRTLDMQPSAVSATEIRHTVAQRMSLTPLVFDSVARYIDQHHLYQTA
jgi:nicotinate-nucleotide adenylyltransferase